MRQPDAVESLFNAKASTWSEKYAANGPLYDRLQAFGHRLRALISPPAAVLDFGCGTGNLARYLNEAGYRVSACDIAGRMIAEAQAADPGGVVDWCLLSVDWQRLPFSTGAFDAVVASSVFEYLNDVPTMFAECQRTLKDGGFLVFTVPNPNNIVRHMERLIRPAVALLSASRISRLVPRVDRYCTYLACSRNRWSVAEWSALAAPAGFAPVDSGRAEPVPRGGTSPLMFLSYRKVPSSASAELPHRRDS
jgi:ubiquinone/menaquinone biosynthesis C-methylase UbiE